MNLSPNNIKLPPLKYTQCPFCEDTFDDKNTMFTLARSKGSYDDYLCSGCGNFRYMNVHYENDGPAYAHMCEYKIDTWTINQFWRVKETVVEERSKIVLIIPKILEVNIKNTYETIEKIKFYLTFS
jgi:hypothetical protein